MRSPAPRRPQSRQPRSPRPSLRSPRPPRSPRGGRKSPSMRRPLSPRRRSPDRGPSRRGPRSPPPKGPGGNGLGGGKRRKKGRRRWRTGGRKGGKMGMGGGGPPVSGGNSQPIASMRMRMDDYRPPRAERLLRDPKEVVNNDHGPIEQVVVRARREASTRTKDTFWTKKLLDAEATQPNRWAHSGFKELYRDELGYSDIGEISGDDEKVRPGPPNATGGPGAPGGGAPGDPRASSRPRDPRDPGNAVTSRKNVSPRPRSPQDPRRRSRSRSPRRSPRRSPQRPGAQRGSRDPKAPARRKRTTSRSPRRVHKRTYSSSLSRSSSSSTGSSYSRSYSSYSRSSSGSSSSSYTSSSSSSGSRTGSRRRRSYSPRRPRSISGSPRRGRVNRRPPQPNNTAPPPQVRMKQVTHQETTKKLVTKTVSNVVIKSSRNAINKIPKIKSKKLKEGEPVVRRKARTPPQPAAGYYDENAVRVEEPVDQYRGPGTPPRATSESGRHLLDPHHYKVVPPDHPDYHRPPPPPRESPRSDGEESDSDSSSDDDDGPRRMTLSERFGKLAQLSSQRQEYEGVRMKIVREGGQDKKVYLEAGRLQSRSPSPAGSRTRAQHPNHERWLKEHQAEYREYQERYGEIRQWDPHRDLPRELPQNWDDVHVRYRYYKESGYFGDRSITLDDYLKWEEWWYRYRDWLEKCGNTGEEDRDWYRTQGYDTYDARTATATQGRWPRREPSREEEDRKRRRY